MVENSGLLPDILLGKNDKVNYVKILISSSRM